MAAFLILALARWLHFGSVMALFGASLFSLYAASRDREVPYRAAAILAAASGMIWAGSTLLAVAANSTEAFDRATLSAFFLETQFGRVWLARAALLVGLLVAAFMNRGRGRAVAIAALSGALLVSQAWLGHAAGGPDWGLAVYALHVLAGGAWLGGLVGLAATMEDARRAPDSSAAYSALQRFSAMGIVAVALILASGIVNCILRLDTLSALFATNYGRTLLVKIALVAVMVGVALYNRVRLMPLGLKPSSRERALALLGRNVAIEQALGALVLAAAALLGALSPMG
jgi:putative copper resistance protein D